MAVGRSAGLGGADLLAGWPRQGRVRHGPADTGHGPAEPAPAGSAGCRADAAAGLADQCGSVHGPARGRAVAAALAAVDGPGAGHVVRSGSKPRLGSWRRAAGAGWRLGGLWDVRPVSTVAARPGAPCRLVGRAGGPAGRCGQRGDRCLRAAHGAVSAIAAAAAGRLDPGPGHQLHAGLAGAGRAPGWAGCRGAAESLGQRHGAGGGLRRHGPGGPPA